MSMGKIKNELKKYNEFLKTYEFSYEELVNENEVIKWKNYTIINSEGEVLTENEALVNVGYKLKGALPKALSNLFPYEFVFKGKKVHSIESVFQGIKFKNKKAQNLVLNYSGLDSNNIKIASDYNWKDSGILYWQGKPIDRHSENYKQFINELYVSALQNPLYRQILVSVKDRYILHHIGETDAHKTVFTRYEFEKQLNSLKSFLGASLQ